MSYLRIWQFQVKRGLEQEFETIYGPEGDWAQLFRRAAEYEGTELVRDVDARGRYLTIDRWKSDESFAAFRLQFSDDYDELDKRCEHLTQSEANLGDFTAV
jgi:heme-degrading monooxygenase HmoA